MNVREFQKQDWSAFAGCEAFPGTDTETLPLFASGTFENGEEFVLVLDRNGACLVADDEQAVYGGYCLELPFPLQATARAFAEGIGEPRHKLDFFLLGFKPI